MPPFEIQLLQPSSRYDSPSARAKQPIAATAEPAEPSASATPPSAFPLATATRTLNYTLGTDNTSLWVGFVVNQHVTGGSGTLATSLWLGNDNNNYLALGSPWNGFYDGISNINGSTYYMQSGATPAAAAIWAIDERS